MGRKVIVGNRNFKVAKLILEDGTELPVDMRILAYIPRKVDKEPYVKVYQDVIGELLVRGEISKNAFKILLWFIKQTNWNNNWIYISYKELGEELKLHKETVRKAIRELVNYGLLVQIEPRKTVFRLNPRYIYKGGVVGKEQDIDF